MYVVLQEFDSVFFHTTSMINPANQNYEEDNPCKLLPNGHYAK